jgi:hypothetical protein
MLMYGSRHKTITGRVVSLTGAKQYEDSLMDKKTNFCRRRNCKFILNYLGMLLIGYGTIVFGVLLNVADGLDI